MKRCLNCKSSYLTAITACQACGFTFEVIDGFPAYSSALAVEGSGFKSSYFVDLASLEAINFWFRARNKLIVWALSQYCPNFQSFLEIGCGTGFVLSGIAKAFPQATLEGSELFTQGLVFAANRLPSVNLMQMDARQIPYINEFDCIGAFDVLEHIDEDQLVLSQINQALKPNGALILTVPQHAWLWSPVDDYACHKRRYSASELKNKLTAAGFDIIRSTSFVTSLLPAMYLSRLSQKFSKKSNVPSAGLDIAPWLNFIFEKLLNAETWLIKLGINFPIGGSRLVIAKKTSEIR